MLRIVAALALLLAVSTTVPAEDVDADIQAINNALEYEHTGGSLPWSNHETGNSGVVTVTSTFFRTDGTPCRTYTPTNGGLRMGGGRLPYRDRFWHIDESGTLPGENAPW